MAEFETVGVWGARTATPQEVEGFEETWVELSDNDIARRNRKVKPRDGTYVMDGNKFSPEPNKVALFNANGEMRPVPQATYQRYLRKRDKFGNRIFYSRPPKAPPPLTSDPCPAYNIDGGICGKRMRDQFELIQHIMKKHKDRAAYYLNQGQMEAAQGKIIFHPGEGINEISHTEPEMPTIPDNGTTIGAMAQEVAEIRREEATTPSIPPPADVEEVVLVDVRGEIVEEFDEPVRKPKPTNTRAESSRERLTALRAKHTCHFKGGFGKYAEGVAEGCVECTTALARQNEAK